MKKLKIILRDLLWWIQHPGKHPAPEYMPNNDFDDIHDPVVLRGVIDAVYDGAAEWEDRARTAEKLLHLLLILKDRKDNFGKDGYYLENQPKVWRMVYRHLKMYHYDVAKMRPQ